MDTTKPPRPAKMDMRPFYTAKIKELLEEGPKTRGQMIQALGVHDKTIVAYLQVMREDGIARRNGYLHGAPLWELGEEEAPPKKIGQPVGELTERQATVPARQVGMFRHWMDVALFGPAQGAAA